MRDCNQPRIFTIAPGIPFIREMILALLDGRIIESFQYKPSNPLSLASVTIYVPTEQVKQALRSEFLEIIGTTSTILPLIKSLGNTFEEEDFTNQEFKLTPDLNSPLSGIARLLELARLIIVWRNRLPDSIRDIHSNSPIIAPASPADAIWLAKSLAELIDTMEAEEKNLENLHFLNHEKYGDWWILTSEFLKIASQYWRERLSELNLSSPVLHQIALINIEAERLIKEGTKGPVIVAGSTGSVLATSKLISVIAKDPNGAIILPGLDVSMPETLWDIIANDSNSHEKKNFTSATHPQYTLAKLLKYLKIERKNVISLGKLDKKLQLRSFIISQALAPLTEDNTWHVSHSKQENKDFDTAFFDVALIEAKNEREEATAIAVALRLALERPGFKGRKSKAALITADRNLARRVKIELMRFNIEVDDSAGMPLSMTLKGSLLKLLLEATLKPSNPISISSFIKHPLARFGFLEKKLSIAKNALEIIALHSRMNGYGIADLKSWVLEKLSEQKKEKYSPRWRSRLPEDSAELAIELASAITNAVQPLISSLSSQSFKTSEWAYRTACSLESICTDENHNLYNLWSGTEGELLASFFTDIIETDGHIEANGPEWIEIVAALMAGKTVRPKPLRYPRIFLFGTIESRLLDVDTLILGGLNEGIWPSQPPKNPFLSRMMKADIGLEPPEKRIGQAAHDFEMANGTNYLIYTRSLQKESVPTIASRWLQRLLALGGKNFTANLKERGNRYLEWAHLLDVTEKQLPAKRPSPYPLLQIQPKIYSFSEIKKLIHDPYSIYAKKILKLDPMPQLQDEPSLKERGSLFHKIISEFIQDRYNKNTLEFIQAMDYTIESFFEKEKLPPHIELIWKHHFRKIAYSFLVYEENQQPYISQVFSEIHASMDIPSIGITLTGFADRIDILKSGFARIIDYKSGNNPSKNDAKNLIDPQLALEAAALREGAFSLVGCQTPQDLFYIRLKPDFQRDSIVNTDSNKNDATLFIEELSKKALEQLIQFIKLLQNGEKPFISCLRPSKKYNFIDEYHHLARVAEWETNYEE
ncbi:ATP-dependent nuclease subunit B [Liberibacter crescens BT-1]|uniref:ATP-dependent nuclease subunit B n=1 Tax=Liberibacter crescens (strain BT-1) TaxID=1215343 RepID=L0EWW3_LIBCB|nr:double-strand break repair protein AddB [Liberibacter crescens]AGA65355.1 ATP-dependent nuclease subunit B [Liberibacter crescens BT-1]AMC12294.1 recombinase RecB [Liberibacter crescens]